MIAQLTRRQTIAALLAIRVTRPAVAFHYAALFSASEVRWYSRFELLVTGGILSPQQSAMLRQGGSRLIAYEWCSGFYAGDWVSAAEIWQKQVKPDWLLTREPVTGAAAEGGKLAHWYDFANPNLIAARAAYLAGLLANSGYNGYFFDTPGFESLPPPAQEAFRASHPGLDYNRCLGDFFGALRRQLPAGKLIFTNQGYRHADYFLPHADLDLTESYFTYIKDGATKLRPWHDPEKPWESIRTPMVELVGKAEKKWPRVRFVHVNYAAGPSEEAALYGYAAAKLFGHEAYLIVPSSTSAEQNPVYSTSLGRPLSANYEEDAAAGAVWRRYENGVVALFSGSKPFLIPATKVTLRTPGRGYVVTGSSV